MEQSSSLLPQTLCQETVVEEKRALVHFMGVGGQPCGTVPRALSSGQTNAGTAVACGTDCLRSGAFVPLIPFALSKQREVRKVFVLLLN